MTDEKMLDLLLNDPQHGLEQAVRSYTPYVMKIVCTKLSGICTHEDIEEIVSDVFMMFYQSIGRYGGEVRSVKALLAVIARRKCADVYEKMKREKAHFSCEELSENIPDEQSFYDRTVLMEALHSLGHPDEQIMIRRYFFGQKSKEIADDLNLKPNTVDQRISRALRKLKKILEEES